MHAWFADIQKKFSEYIIGHDEMLQLLLTAFLANGHVLLEGLPGTGKTFQREGFGQATGSSF